MLEGSNARSRVWRSIPPKETGAFLVRPVQFPSVPSQHPSFSTLSQPSFTLFPTVSFSLRFLLRYGDPPLTSKPSFSTRTAGVGTSTRDSTRVLNGNLRLTLFSVHNISSPIRPHSRAIPARELAHTRLPFLPTRTKPQCHDDANAHLSNECLPPPHEQRLPGPLRLPISLERVVSESCQDAGSAKCKCLCAIDSTRREGTWQDDPQST